MKHVIKIKNDKDYTINLQENQETNVAVSFKIKNEKGFCDLFEGTSNESCIKVKRSDSYFSHVLNANTESEDNLQPADPRSYLTFSSNAPLTLQLKTVGSPISNGCFEYSLDTIHWNYYTPDTNISSDNGKIYMRGNYNGNFKQSANDYRYFVFNTTDKVSCTGNIGALLCYTYTLNGYPKDNLPDLSYCCYRLFLNCKSLITAPTLDLPNISEKCYAEMFRGCTSLAVAPILPNTTLANSCYEKMFYKCTSLINPPELPAKNLNTRCYANMFYGCTSLKSTPELPAMTLSEGCYNEMFYGCISLTEITDLPATKLTTNCYLAMFQGCTSLVNAVNILPAYTPANNCYSYMFADCTSLVNAPKINLAIYSNNDAESVYYMFYGCNPIDVHVRPNTGGYPTDGSIGPVNIIYDFYDLINQRD